MIVVYVQHELSVLRQSALAPAQTARLSEDGDNPA
jgi:hypothetical protein